MKSVCNLLYKFRQLLSCVLHSCQSNVHSKNFIRSLQKQLKPCKHIRQRKINAWHPLSLSGIRAKKFSQSTSKIIIILVSRIILSYGKALIQPRPETKQVNSGRQREIFGNETDRIASCSKFSIVYSIHLRVVNPLNVLILSLSHQDFYFFYLWYSTQCKMECNNFLISFYQSCLSDVGILGSGATRNPQ